LALIDQLATVTHGRIDRSRSCLWAFSAGGVVLSLLYSERAPDFACVIAFYPILDVPPDQASEDWRRTNSPVAALSAYSGTRLAPMLLVRAGQDAPFINTTIDNFMTAARARNAPVELVNLPEAHHAFDLVDDKPWSRRQIEDAFTFATRHVAR